MVGLMVCLVLAGVTGWIGYTYWYKGGDSVSLDDLIVRQVDRGPFDHVVLEQGEIESSSNKELICEVESRGSGGTQILWVIDEGTRVKKGDKLVELDSSSLEQDLKEARLKVLTAKSNVKTAEAVLEQAEIAKQEYLEGVYIASRLSPPISARNASARGKDQSARPAPRTNSTVDAQTKGTAKRFSPGWSAGVMKRHSCQRTIGDANRRPT